MYLHFLSTFCIAKPRFVGSMTRHVLENSQPGTPVGSNILAEFPGVRGTVFYSLVDSATFSIDSVSGQLFVNCFCLNREEKPTYSLNVTASTEEKSISQTLEIKLDDIIDEKPVFEQSSYHIFIWLGTQPYSQITHFEFSDPDKNDIVSLSLADEQDIFTLTGSTLYNTAPLNQLVTYSLKVVATDSAMLQSLAEVHVLVVAFSGIPFVNEKVIEVVPNSIPNRAVIDLSIPAANVSIKDCHLVSDIPDMFKLDLDFVLWMIKPMTSNSIPVYNRIFCVDNSQQLEPFYVVIVKVADGELGRGDLYSKVKDSRKKRQVSPVNLKDTPFRVVSGQDFKMSHNFNEEDEPLIVYFPENQPSGTLKIVADTGHGYPNYTVQNENATSAVFYTYGNELRYYFPPNPTAELDSPCSGLAKNISFTIDQYNLPFNIFEDTTNCQAVITNTRPLDAEIDPAVYSFELSSYLIVENQLTNQIVYIEIRIGDVNDHSPRFLSSTRNFTLKENFVGPFAQVDVIDEDISKLFSLVDFSIEGNPYFTISNSGVISSKKPFDFETDDPCYDLQVIVADSMGLSNDTSIVVCLEDTNDNCPTFVNFTVYVEVPEDTEPGTTIARLSAVDYDESTEFQTVAYYFLPPNLSANDSFPFYIEESRGLVILAKKVDFEMGAQLYEFPIYASDENGLACGANVTFSITNVNDEAPIFRSTFISVNVKENVYPFIGPDGRPNVLGCFEATDLDSEEISYFITINTTSFFMSDKYPGCVILNESLDFEANSQIKLPIKATDGKLVSTESAIIDITVDNVADSNGPYLLAEYVIDVLENELISRPLVIITPFDVPEDIRRMPVYDMSDPKCLNYFQIDGGGRIYMMIVLDYEKYDCKQFQVTARHNEYILTTQVYVNVRPANDHRPTIDSSSTIDLTIEENVPAYAWEYEIMVSDRDIYPDGSVDNLTLELTSTEELFSFFFAVNYSRENPFLVNKRVFDYESDERYFQIVMYAFDGKQKSFSPVYVFISVINTNDIAPTFERKIYNFSIVEESGDFIEYILAEDEDSDNNLITYSFEPITEGFIPFDVSKQTGAVRNTEYIDAEEMLPEYRFFIIAEDEGQLSNSAEVVIHIHDYNEYRPRFRKHSFNAMFPEDTPVGTTIDFVTATDKDIGPVFGKIHYNLIHSDPSIKLPFTVEQDTGRLYLFHPLDYEKVEYYEFLVVAEDGGGLSATARANVDVKDVDDVPPCPCEDSRLFSYNITENEFIHSNIWRITVCNGFSLQDTFFNLSNSYSNMFEVDDYGRVFIKQPLDYENMEQYVINITLSSTKLQCEYPATLVINVMNLDEFLPQFNPLYYSYNLQETQIPGFLLKVYANDADRNDKIIGYNITTNVTSFLPFEITDNGTISLTKHVDFDDRFTNHRFRLSLLAQNIHGHVTETPAILDIILQDMNDESPVFTQSQYLFMLSENNAINVPLFAINATDKDISPAFRNITYAIISRNSPFSVNSESGKISARLAFDHELLGASPVFFRVQASDGLNIAQASVTVTLTDVNEHSPIFQEERYQFEMHLNATSGDVVGSVIAIDPDSTGTVQRYSIISSSGSLERPFIVTSDGQLKVNFGSHDTLSPSFVLNIVAYDEDNMQSLPVEVIVSFIGLDSISMQSSHCVSITENYWPTEAVLELRSFDENPKLLHFRYSLFTAHVPFTVETESGKVLLTQPLDFEENNHYSLSVKAINRFGIKFNISIDICVLNINDWPPEFTNTSVTLFLHEFNQSQTLVSIPLRDADHNLPLNKESLPSCCSDPNEFLVRGNVTFLVTGGGQMFKAFYDVQHEFFHLRSLVSSKQLKECQYTISISAYDSAQPELVSQALIIELEVAKTLQYPPVFINSTRTLEFNENEVTTIAIISAQMDPAEVCVSSFQATIAYSIQSAGSIPFDIDQNGRLYNTKPLDYEKDVRAFEFIILASNNANLSSSLTVSVRLNDVNDFCPLFPSPSMKINVSELSSKGDVVTRLSAMDSDGSFIHRKVVYFVINDNYPNLFDVTLDGEVEVVSAPLYMPLGINTYQYQIGARNMISDSLNCSSVSVMMLTLEVVDENNRPPRFTQTTYMFEILENTIATEISPYILGVLKFQDDDTTMDIMKFSITPEAQFISIQPDGSIHLVHILDYETEEHYTFKVSITDGQNNGTNEATIKLLILNVNEYPPDIVGPINVTLEEGTLPIDGIAQFSAMDKDLGMLGEISLTLEGQFASLYRIDSMGVVYNIRQFDYENDPHHYNITIVARDGGGKNTSAVLQVQLLDRNDNMPVFTMSAYQVNVTESQTLAGTTLLKTIALDEDVTPQFNTILYDLRESESANRFLVNSSTGDISALQPIDFESDPHEYAFEVIATDGNHANVASVKIFILDSNDHRPIILHPNDVNTVATSLNVNIPEDLSLNSLVIELTAVDKDLSEQFHKTNFTLIKLIDGALPFTVTPSGGIILTGSINRNEIFDFSVIAVDGGGLTSQPVTITITIDPVNKGAPFFEHLAYSYSLKESTIPDFPIANLTGVDPDSDSVSYFLASGLKDFLTVDHLGQIFVLNPFDFEESPNYTFSFGISDGLFNSTSNAVIQINILPVNEFSPTVTSRKSSLSILESTPPGHFSHLILASDRDKDLTTATLGHGDVAEIMLVTQTPYFKLIDYGNGTALLINNISFDFESGIHSFRLRFVARDGGNFISAVAYEISIAIQDVNDNIPQFTVKNPSFEFPENVADYIGQVSATDADITDAYSTLNYSIVEVQNKNCTVDIEITNEGDIFTVEPLDYECIRGNIQFSVLACDPDNLCSLTLVTLVLTNQNEFPPIFEKSEYVVVLDESIMTGTVILVVEATDGDFSPTYDDAITYEAYSLPDVFSFSSNGRLAINEMLDYETQAHEYIFQVGALDGQGLRGLATVFVYINNTNEYPPEFDPFVYERNITEGSFPVNDLDQETRLLFTLNWIDKDSNPELPEFKLTFISQTGPFNVDKFGRVLLTNVLDFEKVAQFEFSISARDGELFSQQPAIVRITVLDINDNPPYFRDTAFNFTFEETYLPPGPILQVVADDKDIAPSLQYFISSISDERVQNIMLSQGGDLHISRPFDYDTLRQIKLQIGAFDGLFNSTNLLTIVIHVLPVNDIKPYFPKSSYAVTMDENTPPLTFSITVHVSDEDVWPRDNNQANLTFHLSGTSYFAVRKERLTRAVIYNTKSLDYESDNHTYLLTLTADDGRYTTEEPATIRINLRDINDHRPQFQHHNQSFSVLENSRFIGRVTADDEDGSAFNSKVSYSIIGEVPFTVDEEGTITPVGVLDYELLESEYKFRVKASDRSGLSDTIVITVFLQDENDNSPYFQETLYSTVIREDQPVNSIILEVKGHDDDQSLEFGITNYTLRSQRHLPFDINLEGHILLTEPLDYEDGRHLYFFEVIAFDGSGLMGSSEVRVNVTNVPDVPPCADRDVYSVEVEENTLPNGTLLKLTVPYNDGGSRLNFSLIDQENVTKLVHLSPEGFLTLRNSFNYEASSLIKLTVSISNNFLECPDLLMVNIYVLDVNEYAPALDIESYNTSVPENTEPDILLMVTVNDADGGIFGDILEFIIQPADVPFQISRSGSLFATRLFDAETDPIQFQFEVYVIDTGRLESKPLNVIVKIDDLNEFMPQLSELPIDIYLAENTPLNKTFYTVEATDKDRDTSVNDLTYSVTNGSSLIRIDKQSGDVSLVSQLDFETSREIRTVVSVSDGTYASDVELHIVVIDVNEESPEILNTLPSDIFVEENISINKTIDDLTIEVRDKDSGSALLAQIFGSKGYFNITTEISDNDTMIIRTVVSENLDYESQNTMFVLVYHICDVEGLCIQLIVKVHISNVNEFPPVFGPMEAILFVPEAAMVFNPPVHMIAVSDEDGGQAGNTCCLYSKNDAFEIDKDCNIRLIRELDYCSDKVFSLPVTVTDKGNPPLTAETIIHISISPVNNQPVNIEIRTPEYTMTEESILHLFDYINITDDSCADVYTASLVVKDLDLRMTKGEGLRVGVEGSDSSIHFFSQRSGSTANLVETLKETVYYNDDDEPVTRIRVIQLNISDGFFTTTQEITINIVSENDHVGTFERDERIPVYLNMGFNATLVAPHLAYEDEDTGEASYKAVASLVHFPGTSCNRNERNIKLTLSQFNFDSIINLLPDPEWRVPFYKKARVVPFNSDHVGYYFDSSSILVLKKNGPIDLRNFSFLSWLEIDRPGSVMTIKSKYKSNPIIKIEMTWTKFKLVTSKKTMTWEWSIAEIEWTHVAVTFKGEEVNLYVNGISQGSRQLPQLDNDILSKYFVTVGGLNKHFKRRTLIHKGFVGGMSGAALILNGDLQPNHLANIVKCDEHVALHPKFMDAHNLNLKYEVNPVTNVVEVNVNTTALMFSNLLRNFIYTNEHQYPKSGRRYLRIYAWDGDIFLGQYGAPIYVLSEEHRQIEISFPQSVIVVPAARLLDGMLPLGGVEIRTFGTGDFIESLAVSISHNDCFRSKSCRLNIPSIDASACHIEHVDSGKFAIIGLQNYSYYENLIKSVVLQVDEFAIAIPVTIYIHISDFNGLIFSDFELTVQSIDHISKRFTRNIKLIDDKFGEDLNSSPSVYLQSFILVGILSAMVLIALVLGVVSSVYMLR